MTEAVLHGAFQGTLTAVQGGNFWNGFSAGCIASVAASAWGGGQNRVISDCGGETVSNFRGLGGMMGIYGGASMITFGTISGGAGAALTGGNFWQGAVTGLIVSGLNHAMHEMYQIRSLRSRFKIGANGNYILDPDGDPVFSQNGINTINGAVEGLQDAFVEGKKPIVKFDLTNPNENGETDPGVVHLNTSKIKTNLDLAATLIHEYRHAWQWIYKYNGWMTDHYNNNDIVKHLMERDAYAYQIQFGAGTIANDAFNQYNTHLSLTKWIKNY